jgi:hypothetical protein
MKPTGHAIASGVIGFFVWLYFKSIPAAIVSFLAGTLIDFDHFFDYYVNHHFTLSIRKVYAASSETDFPRLYLLFHSYELVLILWASIGIFSLGIFWKALAIGLTQHIILDQMTNPVTLPAYFIIYRIVKGFKKEYVTH